MMMPLCESRSQKIVASMSMMSLSSRSFMLSMTTAVPWGISLSHSLRIFSRMISAAMTFSG